MKGTHFQSVNEVKSKTADLLNNGKFVCSGEKMVGGGGECTLKGIEINL
jgi:hypothetical protein